MESCPETDVLLSIAAGHAGVPARIVAHARMCQRCRRDIELFADLRDALRAEEPLPEAWIDRILEQLPVEDVRLHASPTRQGNGLAAAFATFVLATVTIALTLLFVTPPGLAAGPPGLLMIAYTTALGGLVAYAERRTALGSVRIQPEG